MNAVPTTRVSEVFVEVSDTLVDQFDLIDFLQMVTQRGTELTGASAAGLLLVDPQGRLQFMAASDERARLLELFQVQADEGPCRDCFHEGAPVVNANLDQANVRWPQFAPRAVEAGFRSVHAFPLRLRKDVIGAMGLFATTAGQIDTEDARVVQALADIATIGLLQERAVQRAEVLTEQLRGALNSRVIIEQAKGAIAQLYGMGVDDAFLLLRGYCRRNQLRLGDVALTFVSETFAPPDLRRTRL